MAFEQRAPIDYFQTSLLVSAQAGSTTMRATAFQSLDSDYGTNGKYLPLVLHDDAQGLYEIVWVSAHAAGSDTVTVVRGKENTAAQPWPAGTVVESAPSSYDALLARTSSTLPADAPIGERAMRGDKKDVVQRANGLWVPDVGVALAADIGPRRSGSIPDGVVPLLRGGHRSGNTGANGVITVPHQSPFPNATVSTGLAVVSTGTPAVAVLAGETAAGITVAFYAIAGGANVGSGVPVTFQYISMGY